MGNRWRTENGDLLNIDKVRGNAKAAPGFPRSDGAINVGISAGAYSAIVYQLKRLSGRRSAKTTVQPSEIFKLNKKDRSNKRRFCSCATNWGERAWDAVVSSTSALARKPIS